MRVLALYLVAEGIASLAGIGSLWSFEAEELYASRVWVTIAMTAPVLLGLVLWCASRTVARWILPPPNDEPPAGTATVQTVAIATFGLFLVAVSIPRLWTSVLMLGERGAWQDEPPPFYKDPHVVGGMVSLAIGVLLCTGARYWSRLLARFRDLGYEK